MNGERSRVQLIKNKFETLSHAQDDQIITAVKKTKPVFQRSRTSINLLEATTCKGDSEGVLRSLNSNKVNAKSKISRQTDDIKREFRSSIKRSPAFRKTGDRASKLHSPIDEKKQSVISEVNSEFGNLTDTLKKALKQPLPKGDPPRKPKRTFETNIQELGYVEGENRALPRKCLTKTLKTTSANIEPEPVYMDPCINHVTSECCKHTNNSKDLHYMCSAVKDTNVNHSSNNDATTYDQINILVGAAFADAVKPDQQESVGVTKLARSLTEKRKDYVIRTASRKDEYRKTVYSLYSIKQKKDEECAPIEPVRDRLNKYKQLIEGSAHTELSQNKNAKPKSHVTRDKRHNLFSTCSLVGFDITKKCPYIKWTFPNTEPVAENLEELVFPSSQLVYQQNLSNQSYIQIITNLEGHRTYAFCRRVIPEGPNTILLPLAYCIITEHLLPSFYFSILREIECRHGQNELFVKNILQNLYRQTLPLPGEQLTCTNVKVPSNPPIPQNNKYTRRLSLENYPKWMKDATTSPEAVNYGARKYSLSDDVIFGVKRPLDPRLENTEISDLYSILGTDVLLTLFSTLLLERKVILLSSSISTLSTCIIGLERLLYPFKWLFPQIVCLPDHIIDICDAPFPIFVGSLKQVDITIENGLIVNLDTKMIVQCCGDENTILPKKLRRSLKRSLDLVNLLDESNTLSSALISEAFLRFFVELLTKMNIIDFNKRELIESQTSASVKLFLEWFIETSMFQNFLHTLDSEKSYYQPFFLKLQEKSYTINRSYQNVEALIRNCHIINKKSNTYYSRLKALFSL